MNRSRVGAGACPEVGAGAIERARAGEEVDIGVVDEAGVD